jgi:hypothetical protein
MGRGLSDLQKHILRLAFKNRQAKGHDALEPDVYYCEVLRRYFALEVAEGTDPRKRRCSIDRYWAVNYDAAHASLSRAMARLEQRDLLVLVKVTAEGREWAGADLTDAGVLEAELLVAEASRSPRNG